MRAQSITAPAPTLYDASSAVRTLLREHLRHCYANHAWALGFRPFEFFDLTGNLLHGVALLRWIRHPEPNRLKVSNAYFTISTEAGTSPRIIAVTFVELRRQRRLHVPRLDADHWQARFSQSAVKPL